jgi:hypothetical protein
MHFYIIYSILFDVLSLINKIYYKMKESDEEKKEEINKETKEIPIYVVRRTHRKKIKRFRARKYF